MKYAKYQKEIVNALLSSGRVCYGRLDNGQIVVSKDGRSAAILNEKQVVFSLPLCVETDSMNALCEKKETDVSCEATGEFRSVPGGVTIQRYKSGKFDIWFNKNIIDDFGPNLSCVFASSPADRALVVSDTGDLIGVVMPMRHSEKGGA